MIQYPRFKLCFEYIKPLQNIGFSVEYLCLPRKSVKTTGNLQIMKEETKKLEQEVFEMENKARMLGLL